MALSFWNASNLAHLPGVVHGFTGRDGGVSRAPFGLLNLGLHVGDEPEAVYTNRERVAEALGLSLPRMVCAEQIHGGSVAVVDEEDAGRGSRAWADAIPGVDALVTRTPNLLLTLFFADCVPVLFADPRKRIVAVAHAGWRGLVGNILENTVQTMIERFDSDPADIEAAIAPCISAAHFEVGDEVAARFEIGVHPATSGKSHIDLPRVAEHRLVMVGVSPSRIIQSSECTAQNSDHYFSHRRDKGKTGRMAACIALRP